MGGGEKRWRKRNSSKKTKEKGLKSLAGERKTVYTPNTPSFNWRQIVRRHSCPPKLNIIYT